MTLVWSPVSTIISVCSKSDDAVLNMGLEDSSVSEEELTIGSGAAVVISTSSFMREEAPGGRTGEDFCLPTQKKTTLNSEVSKSAKSH